MTIFCLAIFRRRETQLSKTLLSIYENIILAFPSSTRYQMIYMYVQDQHLSGIFNNFEFHFLVLMTYR